MTDDVKKFDEKVTKVDEKAHVNQTNLRRLARSSMEHDTRLSALERKDVLG